MPYDHSLIDALHTDRAPGQGNPAQDSDDQAAALKTEVEPDLQDLDARVTAQGESLAAIMGIGGAGDLAGDLAALADWLSVPQLSYLALPDGSVLAAPLPLTFALA